MKYLLYPLIAALFFIPFLASAGLGQDLAGEILLQVEEHGEAWYVYPENHKRYYLKDGQAAYAIMRLLSLGITDADLAKIPAVENTTEMNASTSACSSHSLANQLKGTILLQVEQHGEAWYIDVEKCRRIYLKDGQAAYDVMRFLGLGITNTDLNKISISTESALPEGVEPPAAAKGEYTQKTIAGFNVDLLTMNLKDIEIITDVKANGDCDTNCPVDSLEGYVNAHGGFAGIHGSYFCPSDYSGCASQKDYFFFPVYDTGSGVFVNEDQLMFPTTGPIMVFDQNNDVHVYASTIDFQSPANFKTTTGKEIKAAIGNLPLLIHNGVNISGSATLDDKQRKTKSSRGGIAIKGDTLYLLVAQGATVVDLATIMQSMGVDHGMNLDGGGSSALYFEGDYKVGPGRNLPNAIVIR